jgi:hypothetical protein
MLLCLASLLTVICVILAIYQYCEDAKEDQLAKLRNGSPYARIIANSAGFQDKKYPLRYFLSEQSIGKVKFLGPQELKDNTETAIIVLGDRPLDDTTPTVDMVYRVLKGVELAKKFPKAILIMSGGATKGPTPEAQMMGLISWSRGVNPLRIILEDKSHTTGQNAEYTANIVGSKYIRQVFIVTERSRLKEAVAIFQKHDKEFKNIQGVKSDITRVLIIDQMVRFLMSHDDRIVRERLHYVIKGIKYKAFNFVVIPF